MRIRLRSLAISSLVLTFASAAGARTRPHYGGTVRVESGGSSVSAERAITASLVAETLTSVDAMGRVQPLLAERWESQNGGRRWQFWIRQNIRLHDGSILSAADAAQIFSSQQGSLWRTVRANGSAVILECVRASGVTLSEASKYLPEDRRQELLAARRDKRPAKLY